MNPGQGVVVIITGKKNGNMTTPKLTKLVNKQFTWTNYIQNAPNTVKITITSGLQLKELNKINIPGYEIYPAECDETTILIKTPDTSFSELMKEIRKPGAKNAWVDFLANVNNNKENSQAWNVFVKEGDIQKFLDMDHSNDSVQFAIPYEKARSRFSLKYTPPTVIAKKEGVTIPPELEERVKFTELPDGMIKLKLKGYSDYRALFGKNKKSIVSLGVPFNIFYSKSKMNIITQKTGVKQNKFVEDNSFYGCDSVTEVSQDSEKSRRTVTINDFSAILDSMKISGRLNEYIMEIARNEENLSALDGKNYVEKLLSQMVEDEDGYDILKTIADGLDDDWEQACDLFYDDLDL
jgi:hypothetical protein